MTRGVLMLEFNELSPKLMDRFIAEGLLPNFARLRDRSRTFVTDAGETGDLLNPWVQWVTVHTGVTAAEHGIRQLGEAHLLTTPTLADAVTDADGVVWQCGSMNVQPRKPVNGCLLPDPWSVDAQPEPPELTPFFRFVSANVQEHTSSTTPLSKRETIAFARFLVTHGLTGGTAVATAKQLTGERTGRAARWQRAELLDRFQWDVFRSYYKRLHPTFATFFSNSTAHFQHLEWDELEIVLHGYQQMDLLVQRALALVDDDTTVVLCTGLSQTANTDRCRDGFYRPRDFDELARRLALTGVKGTSPVMAEQGHIFFADADAAARGEAALAAVRSGGEPAFSVSRTGNDVFFGCRFFTQRSLDPPLDEILYWADAPREGTHHPDGILWITSARPRNDEERVPLTTVAPTILAVLGIAAPSSMKQEPLAA